MSAWQIRIPFRDRDDSLTEVADLARELEPEQRPVLRELLVDAAAAGHRSAGDVIDTLARLTPAERRTMLDSARTRAGVATTEQIEDEARFAAIDRGLLRPGFSQCAAEGCTRVATSENGLPTLLNVRRWWCSQHAHLAGADDHLPPESARLDPHTMRLVPPPSGLRRLRKEDEKRKQEHARRVRDREREAEIADAALEKWRAEHMNEGTTVLGSIRPSQVR